MKLSAVTTGLVIYLVAFGLCIVEVVAGPVEEARQEINGNGALTQERIDKATELCKKNIEFAKSVLRTPQDYPPDYVEGQRTGLAESQECLQLWQAASPHKARTTSVGGGARPAASGEEESASASPSIPQSESNFVSNLDQARADAQDALRQLIKDGDGSPVMRAATKQEAEAEDLPSSEGLADELWRDRKEAADFLTEAALHELLGEASLIPKVLQLLNSDSVMITPTPPPQESNR
jgi:hypothetical protein